MHKRASLFRWVTLVLITFLVARAYCASALPRQQYQEAPDRCTLLQLGQSLALADFDGDDRIDRATLGGSGLNKVIEICLSYAKTLTLFHFDTLTGERGSLFTKDIDNDGDKDLIWSDLVHPDDVIIWLNDGSGRFERVCPGRYAKEFVLSDAPDFGCAEIPQQDFAFSPRHDPSPSLLPAHAIDHSVQTSIFSGESRHVPANAFFLATPFDRGPPSRL